MSQRAKDPAVDGLLLERAIPALDDPVGFGWLFNEGEAVPLAGAPVTELVESAGFRRRRPPAVSRRLFDEVRNAPARGAATVAVQRLSARAKARPRTAGRRASPSDTALPARGAALPRGRGGRLWVVHVREQQPPPTAEPLEWFGPRCV